MDTLDLLVAWGGVLIVAVALSFLQRSLPKLAIDIDPSDPLSGIR